MSERFMGLLILAQMFMIPSQNSAKIANPATFTKIWPVHHCVGCCGQLPVSGLYCPLPAHRDREGKERVTFVT
jgi:hypothetical protein